MICFTFILTFACICKCVCVDILVCGIILFTPTFIEYINVLDDRSRKQNEGACVFVHVCVYVCVCVCVCVHVSVHLL